MPHSRRPGELLGGRYRLVDLLSESRGGRFWRAHDRVLSRQVALHVIAADDPRAEGLMEAARSSTRVQDRRVLRVLDADRDDGQVYVVNEWGSGTSLDLMLADGPLGPRRAAWIVSEVAEAVAAAHAAGIAHGRLVPENVLLDHAGHVRLIGLAVDAALHGLTIDRFDDDLVDLAALLYAGMTARWAGTDRSSVEAAPREAGRVLRPRRVRAGVPRALDQLCDELLNDGPAAGTGQPGDPGRTPRSAADLAATLRDFVGDPAGMPATLATLVGSVRRPAPLDQTTLVVDTGEAPAPGIDAPTAVVPLDLDTAPASGLDGPTVAAPGDGRSDHGTPAAAPEPAPAPEVGPPTDLPTEAGVPIFHEGDDEVDWLRARAEKPPPPPPFEDPPERPLFAPEPPPGEPQRRPRPGVAAGRGDDAPWSWEGTDDGPSATGAVISEPEQTDDRVPGRRMLRLGLLLAFLLLATLGAATALVLNESPLGGGDDPTAEESSAPPAPLRPVTALGADDLDPQGDPAEENPDLAGLAVDDDPATAWRTSTYEQQLGPQGLKTGVGLVVDLGSGVAPREVEVGVLGGATTAELYLTDEAPLDVAGLEPVGEASGSQQLAFELDGERSGRYLSVWLTQLPAVGDGFRGEIADVVVRR